MRKLRILSFGMVLFVLLGLLTTSGCGCDGDDDEAVAANAGADQDVLVGVLTTLDGSSSAGVDSASWTITSAPDGSAAALSDETTLAPSITPDVAGDYVIELSVNDGEATDSVTVTAVSAISSILVPEGSAISTRERFGITEYVVDAGATGATLSGSASEAAALVMKNAAVSSYQWEQVSGPAATAVSDTTSETLEFTAPEIADLAHTSDHYKWQVLPISRDDMKMVFKLTVAGSDGESASSTFDIYLQDGGEEIHTQSGLKNVPVGQVTYLCGPSLDASGASATVAANEEGDSVTDWSWTLTVPEGSSATFRDSATTSSTVQCPSFIPDVAGLYTVAYSSTTGNLTTTVTQGVKAPGTLYLSAAEWVGVGTVGGATPLAPQCATCHDGDIEPDMVTNWSATVHAAKFENSIDSYDSLAPEPYLWLYHTVGYDTDAANGGFDDLAADAGFTFPADGLTFSDFTTSYPDVAALANIQCENCHGPGSMHDGDPNSIDYSFTDAGVCGQCHIEENHWKNSAHNSTGVSHGSGIYQYYWLGATCVRCHSTKGFDLYLEEGEEGLVSLLSDEQGGFPGVTCVACHDPHDATNEDQLRLQGEITMAIDGSTVDAGKAAVCYTCHDGNYSHGEYDCDTNGDGVTGAASSTVPAGNTVCSSVYQTATEYWRGGMHYVSQGPMLEGKQAITDLDDDGDEDLTLDENSFHTDENFTLATSTGDSSLSAENNKCVTCHMSAGPAVDEEGYGHLGGHAFKLRVGHSLGHYLGNDEGDELDEEVGELELVSSCTVCHASVTEINRTARADYDGDGSREGIQDEVSGLLYNLWVLMKVVDTANGGNMNQASASCTSGTSTVSNTTVGPTSTSDASGTVTVDSVAWKGCCSSFSSSSTPCKPAAGIGTCTNVNAARTRDDYQNCNFLEAPAYLRTAVWNFNSVVRDGSLGIHNTAYTIQMLQETYKALGRLSLLNKSGAAASATTFTYQTDYPSATLR